MLYVICSAAPAGDVSAVEAYGEELHRLLMICSRDLDADDEEEADLVAVAVNNLAYICRDLGTERFAPFFQGCIEVMAKILSTIPPSDEATDDASHLKLMEALSDAIDVLAAVYAAAFLPALAVFLPPITDLAAPTSSGKPSQTPNPFSPPPPSQSLSPPLPSASLRLSSPPSDQVPISPYAAVTSSA